MVGEAEGSNGASRNRRWLLPLGVAAFLLVVVGGIAVLVLLIRSFAPAVGAVGDESVRTACASNLRAIGAALRSYHDSYDSYPPAYCVDKVGQPTHSWRVLLLPYLGEYQLYSEYRFDEPWDGPNNFRLHDRMVKVYDCPGSANATTDADYLVVVGPGAAFEGSQPVRRRHVRDGVATTIFVVEALDESVHWMEPRDLSLTKVVDLYVGDEDLDDDLVKPPHGDTIYVLMGDGEVKSLEHIASESQLRAMLTRDGDD